MDIYSKIKIGDKVSYKHNPNSSYTVIGHYDNNNGLILEDKEGKRVEICRTLINDCYYILKNTKIKVDNVSHPIYYNCHPSGIECIDIARHYCFSIGNAFKYLWRAGLKGDANLSDKEKEIEDLKKAIWYINDRINQLENEQTNS